MKKYYISEHGERTGPFTFEELKEKKIFPFTNIWNEEQQQWAPAFTFPELKILVTPSAPTFTINKDDPHFGYMLASAGERFIAMIITGFVSLLVSLIFIIPGYIILYYMGESESSWGLLAITIMGILNLAGIAASLGIHILFYPKYSGTYGHKVMSLKVISAEDGKDFNTLSQGLIREAVKSILWQFIIPVMWLLWDKDNQNLYDKITKTIVVKKFD